MRPGGRAFHTSHVCPFCVLVERGRRGGGIGGVVLVGEGGREGRKGSASYNGASFSYFLWSLGG